MILVTATHGQKRTFLRIFDGENHKTHKGHLWMTTENSIRIITEAKDTVEVPLSLIGTIKLRRSLGHTVLISALVAGGSLAAMGVATADPDAWIFGYTAGEGFMLGLTSGAILGSGVGAIVGGTRNRPVLQIQSDPEKWRKAREILASYLPVNTRSVARN